MESSQQHKLSEATQSDTHSAGKKGVYLSDNRGLSSPIQRKPNNTGLPEDLKSGIENLSGHSLDDVKVHYNSSQPAQLNAHAYAQGNNIHIAPGQEKHLPHEAWHVVQQKQGRVKPTMQLKTKVNVNNDASLEKEADVMGAKAVQLSSQPDNINRKHAIPTGNVQRYARQLPRDNRAVVQGYFELGKGLLGYSKGTGADAPQFEFQKTEALRTENAATSEATYDANTIRFFENAPNLRVANSYNMAVPTSKGAEAKHFFATAGVIAASNAALHTANAPLRLQTGAGKITLPTLMNPQGVSLSQVSPDLSNVVLNGSACGTFAADILGVDVHKIELTVANAPVQTELRPGSVDRETDLTHALGGHQPEHVGANSNASPEVGEAFGILSRRAPAAPAAVNGLWNNIVTLRGLLNETVPHMKWGEHWAGVVAKSGGDYVTLENYNRHAAGTDLILERLEKDYKAVVANGDVTAYVRATAKYLTAANERRLARIARLGSEYVKFGVKLGGYTGYYEDQLAHMWYFAMYGSAQQSFHEAWRKSVNNPVTVKIPR